MFDISKHNPSWIIVAGDWHRNPYAAFPKRVIKLAKELQIDTIVHVGDFGYKFGTTNAYTFEKPLHQALIDAGVHLVWIDGNHENHEMLRTLEPLPNGFIQTGARGNIYYAPRGHRWEWSGKKFGALGGAWSPNWRFLKAGVTLFELLEETKPEDLERLGYEKLDYLIAHDVPSRISMKSFIPGVVPTQTRELLQKAVDRTKPERVFSGHWHTRLDFRIPRSDGGESWGHVLNKEWTLDNILILDLWTNEIVPLPTWWTAGENSEK